MITREREGEGGLYTVFALTAGSLFLQSPDAVTRVFGGFFLFCGVALVMCLGVIAWCEYRMGEIVGWRQGDVEELTR